MNLYQFRQLTPLLQLQHALVLGTYLTHRWESRQRRVNLYHLDDGGQGFLVEVGYDDVLVELHVLRSFPSSVPLVDYPPGVGLPGE